MNLCLLAPLALLILLPNAAAEPTQWSNLRNGSLYLRPCAPDTLQVNWTPAWQSDANQEQLYLLSPTGQLLEQLDIQPEQAYGTHEVELASTTGDYRLQIPGYSFRAFNSNIQGSTATQFEPTRVHFSAKFPDGFILFFQVRSGEQAILAGKYHGGVSLLEATRLSDGTKVVLELGNYEDYGQFDQVALATAQRDEIWRLSLGGSGKAAFWLDGTANLFSQDIAHLHPLKWSQGDVQLTLKPQVLGQTPRLGVSLPYARLPNPALALQQSIGSQSAGFYSLFDARKVAPLRELEFRRSSQEDLHISSDITLLAGTDRHAMLVADENTLAGLDAWLADSLQLEGKGLHYLAFADEPNLNYPDYESYAAYFQLMLQHLKADPRVHEAGVRVAIPASSRLIDGPMQMDGSQRRGIDWARRLLAQHDPDIDALAWHEWMIRDLLATRRYHDSVRAAADLVGRDTNGRPRKALLLSQTNISSGMDVSPYQQDTHYASLWWTSVVINASRSGLLDMLNWSLAIDEKNYPKGMLIPRDNTFAMKPVAIAQQFIQQHWLTQVLDLHNSAFEVDALAMFENNRYSILGVNKTPRRQSISINAMNNMCQQEFRLNLLGPSSQPLTEPVPCIDNQVRFELPAETIFALTWEVL